MLDSTARSLELQRCLVRCIKDAAIGLKYVLNRDADVSGTRAGNVNHAAITVFGAINTVIAGLLTFLKGSGLPNRVKYYRNEWKKLREYIEQREREFIINPDAVSMEDVQQAVLAIGQMYEDIQADVDANTPDAFVSASNARLKVQAAGLPRGLAVGQLKTPNVTLPEVNTRDVNEKIQGANEQIHVVNRAVHDFSEKVEGANERIHDVQEKAHHGFGARLGELKEMAVQFGSQRDKLKNELGSVEGSRSKAENFVSDISRKAKEIAEEMVKHEKEAVNDVSNQIHNRAHDAVEHARSTADGMHHDVHGALGSAQRHTRDAVSHAGGTVSNAQHDAVEFADRQRQAGHIAFDTAQERVQTIAENAHQGVQDAADRERRQVRDAEESAHDTVHKALQ